MKKEIMRREFIVSVGADWNKTRIQKELSTSTRGIKEFVSNPKYNHFKITIECLRKGSKALAQNSILLSKQIK